ncbi:helix-turn-helix transcriptional regulator [Cypionkella sp.]|uniref:helix-turn-helix transcriptional regulator n=1 Tax=Cypionkella sp. TaxID=2811411 RepID=UPI002ABB243A|nr:LuxR C-terminal-related transcriptional regulator [Cypionkella sp.]MDZ4395558.1 LuxR C-terminal-related transcriptional regulator [Cypionkella sp.]
MNMQLSDYSNNHRADFAQYFCTSAELQGVFMGFFDGSGKIFTDAWISKMADCSQETVRTLVKMAESRLIAHSNDTVRADVVHNQPGLGDLPDKTYPIWISNGRNVVGIGAPIAQSFPVMAFPRLGHVDLIENQPLLRIGMAYVTQQLAESLDCRNNLHLASLQSVISLLALRVFVVNSAGLVVYHQSPRQGAVNAIDRIVTGEKLTLVNKRECVALREAIRAATKEDGRSSLLSLTSLGQDSRLALVAPMPQSSLRMAIVLFGEKQIRHSLQHERFFDSYEMTPSERLVAREVLLGKQLNEISASTGLSLSTIRSYLKQIFAKTRTHRQIDLVLLYYQT